MSLSKELNAKSQLPRTSGRRRTSSTKRGRSANSLTFEKLESREVLAQSVQVGGDAFLQGDYVEVGVNSTGSFGSANNAPVGFHTFGGRLNVGFWIDQDGINVGAPPTNGDYFLPGTPEESVTVGFRTGSTGGPASNFTNAERVGEVEFPGATTIESTPSRLAARTIGTTLGGAMQVNQKVSFHPSSKFLTTEVTMTNLSAQTLYKTRYMRSIDPDQDRDLSGTFSTRNSVLSNPPGIDPAVVLATGEVTNQPVLMLSLDPRARASSFGFSNRDVYDSRAWDSPGVYTLSGFTPLPNGTLDDVAITVTFELGDLAPGATASFVYYQSFDLAETIAAANASLEGTIVGGQLQVRDFSASGNNNNLNIRVIGTNLVVTDAFETFTPASASDTGGNLSDGGRTLTVPLANIPNGVTVDAALGTDRFDVGSLTGLSRLNAVGGAGDDTFGTALNKLKPTVGTLIVISGASDTSVPTTTTTGNNAPAATGDELFLDISDFPTTGEVVDTVSGQVLSLTPGTHQPFYFNNVELLHLCDNGLPTNTVIGDLYVRTATGASDSLVFYQGYTASSDVLAKINGRLISSSPFRPISNIIVYGRDMNDAVELNFTIGNRLRAEFYGEDGNDTLSGGGLNDLLVGGNGSDMLISSDGNDTLWGDNIPAAWAGRQTSGAGDLGDSLYGGNGADFLFGQGGSDRVYGEGGDDYSHGGDGNDTLADTLGNNTLRGEAGADSISGSSGNDILLGGSENDILTGFGGRDLMIGGMGLDNVQDTNDNADDILIGDSSPLESDSAGAGPNFAVISPNDALLAPIFANWLTLTPFAARVTALQASGIKATAADGSRDVLRGNQLNQNYFQNFASNDLVRTTTANDTVDTMP